MSEQEKIVRSCLQELGQRYKIFYNPQKKDLDQVGWQETEAEYQARQRAWQQKKDLATRQNTGSKGDA